MFAIRSCGFVTMCFALAFLTACSKGAKGVDAFFGPSAGDEVDNPTYALTFDPRTYDFGEILITNPTPVTKTITVKNLTGVTLFIASANGASATNIYEVSDETCSLLTEGLINNATCQFTLSFQPTASGRFGYNVSFRFGLAPGDESKTSVFTATGRGMAPASLLIGGAPAFQFGPVVQTATSDKIISVTNTGDWPASMIAGSGLTSPFMFKGGSYPGTGGTCGAALAGSTTCTMAVSFTPPTTGPFGSTVDLAYFDGDTNRISQRNIQGAGALPASLSISDGPGFDFGTYAIGASAEKTLTISNTGGVAAASVTGTGLSSPFVFKGGSYPGTGGNCGVSIEAATSCQIVVRFAPTAAGVATNTIDIGYFDGLNGQITHRTVQGTGVTPANITFSNSPTLNFGTTIVGSFVEQTLTLTNSGGFSGSALTAGTLPAPFAFKGGTYPGVGGTCGTTLPSGNSCTVILHYTPTAVGTSTASVSLSYNNGAALQSTSRALEGNAVSAATLLISQAPSYNFGTRPLGSVTEQTFTVSNSGGTPATAVIGGGLVPPFRFKGGAYPGTGGTCAATIAPAASCTIIVGFAPTSSGPQTADIEIGYFNGLSTITSSRTVSGTAVTPANLTVSDGPTYDFGTQPVGLNVTKTFTLTNSGGFGATSVAANTLTSPFAFKGGAFPGTGGTCGPTLAPGASCSFAVTFEATSAASSSGLIDLSYNDGVNTQASTRAVQGTGVTPAFIAISDSPVYDFGPVAVNATSEKTFTLTNSGTFAASSVSGLAFAGPFTFKDGTFPGTGGTCGSILAGGASCLVVVKFAPVALGTLSDTFKVSYSNGVVATTSTRTIQGVGTTAANLTINEGPAYNFGSLPFGSSLTKQFTVTNTGGVPATAIAGAALSAPYSFEGGSFPGTGGSCGTSLSASSACSIVVRFAPTAAGVFTTTMQINYFDAVVTKNSQRDVAGTGVTPATLVIDRSPLAAFGTVAVGGTAELVLNVSNGGQYGASSMNASSLSAPFAYKGGAYPGVGGTCAATLAVGANCQVVVSYTPTVTGTQTATFQLGYFDGAGSQSSSRGLSGSGAAPASLSISDGPTYDFGTIAVGGNTDHVFTVSNSGGVDATSITGSGLSSPFIFKGGAYPGTGGTCTAMVAAGTNCSVVLVFAPTVTGPASGRVNLNFFDGASNQQASRDLSGTAVTPAVLSISDGPLFDFGTLAVSATVDKQLTISNTGSINATSLTGLGLAAPFSYKGGAFPGTGGSCGGTLVNGASCSVVVTFAPTAVGSNSANLQVSYYNGVSTQTSTRAIQGAGAPAGLLTLSDGPTYNFGTWPVGDTRERTLTVTNTGGVTVSSIVGAGLASPFSFKNGSYPGTGGTCASNLAATASCTIVVQFSPTSANTFSGAVNLTYNDGLTSATSSRAVAGIGAPPAALTVSDGPTFDFGTVPTGASAEKSFTVTNSGGYIATAISGPALAAPFSFKGGAYPGTGGSCGATLAASATCTVVVKYSPTTTGSQSGSVALSFFDGVATQSASRALAGIGAAPALLTVSDSPSYTFPTTPVGATNEKTLTLSNSGGVAATTISGSGLAAPFAFKGSGFPGTGGTCSATLSAAANCTIVVTYAPTAIGATSGTVAINYFDGAGTQSATRGLSGNAVATGLLTVSDGPTYNYGTLANGAVGEKTFTITNSGGFSTSSMTGTGLGAPFSFKGGTYPGLGGTCGSSLAASATCDVVVTFAPTTSGNHSGSFNIGYFDGATTKSEPRGVQGIGAAPAVLAFNEGPLYNFGTKATGSTSDKTLILSNAGGVAATSLVISGLNGPFSFKGGTYPGTGGTCATSLGPASSCTVVVAYAPSATGTQASTLSAAFNDGVIAQAATRDVQGTGAAPALLAISNGPTYDFGTIANGASTEKSLTVTNTGGVDATALSGSGLANPFAFKGGSYPGSAGTCGASLASGASCTVILTYSPSTVGTQTGTVDISYSNGVGPQIAQRNLSGTAVAPALLTFSEAPLYDFGVVATGATIDKSLVVTNAGSLAASSMNGASLAPPFSYKGGTYPGSGGTCAGSLAGAQTCTVVVTFAPTVNGTYSNQVALNYFDGANAETSARAIQGVGAAPALIAISDGPTYNFGSAAQGGQLDKTFTLTNTGGVTASALSATAVTAPFSYKGGSYPGTGGTCANTMAAGATCVVVMNFNPSTTGAFSGSFALNYFDGLATQTSTRPMSGTGVTPAILAVSDGPTYDFGTIATGGSADKTLTVTNTGNYTATSLTGLTLSAPFSYKGGSFPGAGGNCTSTLNVGASCNVIVSYSPTATGTQSASVGLSFNDGAQTQTSSRGLQGTGASPSLLTLSDGPSFDFGTTAVGGTLEKTFTLTNTGGVSAGSITGGGVSAPFSFKGGTYPGTGGTCSSTLSASTNCSLVVVYAPTAQGTQNATIQMTYNDGVVIQNATRTISGTAVPAASLSLSDGPTYNFSTVAIGASAEHTLTLSNTGGFQATALTGSGLTSPFSFKGGTYPGLGGTCGSSIAATANCTIVVTFAPTSAGLATATTNINFFDGAAGQSATRALQGTGAVAASLAISDGPTFGFGVRATGSTLDKTFTITNSGGISATTLTANGLNAPFTFKGGAYPGTGGDCATSLAPSASCTIVVSYVPTTTGAHADSLTLNYQNGVSAVSTNRPMTGTGAAPALLGLSDGPSFNFGSLATGGSAEKTITLTNSGGVSASGVSGSGLSTPFAFKGGTFPGTGGTCTTTLSPTANCTIVVLFSPTAVGTFSDDIEVSYNNQVSVQVVTRTLDGQGVLPASITISEAPSYDFGSVVLTATRDKIFTLTNTGSLTSTSMVATVLTAPFTFKGGSFPGTGGNCGATLNPAANCTVVMSFSPTALGAAAGNLEITYFNGASSQVSARPVQGTGATAAQLTISDGSTFNFGSIANGGTAEKIFTITNTGGVAAATITTDAFTAPFAFTGGTYPGTGGTCASTLAPGTNCTVAVVYSPSVIGTQTANLVLNFNDGLAAQSSTRPLTGTSVAPALLSLSDGPTYDFGTRATGSVAEKSLTLSNSGAFTASGLNETTLGAPFTFKGGSYPGTGGNCTSTLAASGNCTLVVVYAPTATGSQSGTVTISYNNGAASQTATRPVQGTGAAPALLTVSDGPTYNFGALAAGSTADKTFTITNSGGVSASTVSGLGLATPFSFKGGTFPGTGGSCLTAVSPSTNCTVVVTYAPTVAGTDSGSFTLSYNDGVATQSATRAVSGSASAPATLTLSDGPTFNFGNVANGSSNDKTVTVTNTGGFLATTIAGTGLSAPYSFKGGSYPGSGGTCSSTLSSGAACTIVVNFAPTASATHNGTVNIGYNNGVGAQTSSLSFTGISTPPALLAISEVGTYDFGTRAIGSSVDKTFTITNSGGFAASAGAATGLGAPITFKGGAFPGTGGTCTTSIAAAASCSVVVTYAPTATGTQTATLTYSYNDGVTTQSATRAIQGTGASAATLTITDGPTFNFGTRATGSTLDKTFTVTNTGGVNATALSGGGLTTPFNFKGGSFPGTGGNCTATLAPTAACTVVVTFAPTLNGSFSSSVDIGFDNGVSAQTSSRAVAGTAVAPAILSISDGSTFDFGPVATTGSSDKVFTLTNSGGLGAVTIVGGGLGAPFTYKSGAFPGTGGTCGGTLAAGATCTFVVTFAPTANGALSSNISISYDNGSTTLTSDRALQGTGAPPALLTVSDGATFDYGTLAAGGTAEKLFTVTNAGGVRATSIAATSLTAPFSFKGGTFPGTGGTCLATLNPTATCTVAVVYSPTAVATHTSNLTLNYNDGLANVSSSRPIQGTAVAPANLSINNGPTYDFGSLANGSTVDATFTVTNGGSFTASGLAGTGLSGPFTFKGGTYPGTGGNCATTLAVAASCTIVVNWSPVATGTQTSTLSVTYNDGAQAQTASRPVTGVGVAPALITVSNGATYDFGTVANGSSTDKSFTLTNSGGINATAMSGSGLATPYAFKGGSYPGTGGNCTASLSAGASCSVVVTFAPTTTNTYSNTMSFSYDNGVSTQSSTRPVTGQSVNPAVLAISDPVTFDFGSVATGGAADKVFTLTNSGNFSASSISGSALTAPYSFKAGAFPGTGGTCGATLAPGASCTFVVKFAPTVDGSSSATVSVPYNDGASNLTASRGVQGTGAPPASLLISDGPTYSFGTLASGGSAEKSLTVSNSGGVNATSLAAATLSAPFSFKGGSYPGTGGTCGATLNLSSSCTITVVYSPTAVASHSGTVQLNYFDGLNNVNTTRNLSGVAVAPANLSINNGPTYDFGSLATGSTLDQTFTVTNNGNFTASSLAGAGLGAPFTFKGGTYPGTGGTCTTSLSVSASCTVVVNWSPTATGSQTSTLSVTYNDGAVPQTASRALMGMGVAPALITVSNGPAYSFGALANGSVNDKSFTLTNSGGISATSINGSGLIAPMSFKGGTFPGTGGNCTASLTPGSACTVVVTFAPSSSGSYTSTMTFGYYDGVSNQSASRDLSGSSSNPAILSISDANTFSFGNKANGSLTDKTFTISNSGAFTASSITPTSLGAPYSFKGGTYPGSGGTCALTLGSGLDCTVVVTYAPTVSATANQTLTLSYNDGVGTQQALRPMTGVSTAPAVLSITPVATYDFGTRATSTSVDTTYTVQNTGAYDATLFTGTGLAAPFSFKGGSFPGTGGNCAATLAASSTCSIVITYAPTATGTQNGSVNFTYNDGAQAQTVTRNVVGTGAAPATITITDGPTYNFGTIAAGGSADKSLTLTNIGGFSALSMSGGGLSTPFSFKGGSFPGTGGNCTASLNASASCTIVVTFAPTINGSYNSSVDISFNNGVTTASSSRPVAGAASDPAALTISDGPTFDFGPVANTGFAEKTFTIANSGGTVAAALAGSGLAAPFTFKDGSFPGTGGTCGSTLNAGNNCTVVVRFAPLSTATSSGSFTVSYNNGIGAQSASRAVQGTGAPAAVITVSDASTYNFGTIANNGSAEHTFTLSNSGGVRATSVTSDALSAPYSFKGGTFPGTGGTCNGLLASGATCTVIVTYSPTTVATHTGTLNITYNDGLVSQSAPRPFTGTAVTPAILSISGAPTYDFGTVAQGASTEATLTVTNTGSFAASGITETGLSAPFGYKGGSYPGTGGTCTNTLAVSANCTLVVVFAPTSTGNQSSTITMNYTDGAQARQSLRPVTGFSAAPALLTLSDGPTYAFGTLANGASASKTLTLSNTGGIAAASIAGGGLAAPFSYLGGTFPGTGGNCGTTLAASASCTVVVNFAPSSTNSYSSTASISYTNGVTSASATRVVTGASAAAAIVTISDATTYDFGTVASGSVASKTFTLSNTGGVTASAMTPVALSAPYAFKDGSYPGTGGTCSATLAASANCTVVVTFSPMAAGSYTGTVNVSYNDGVSVLSTQRPVQGIGAPPANLVLSNGPTYNFGTFAKGSIQEFTFTLTNTGGASASSVTPATLLPPFAFKGGAYPGSGGTCTSTLAGSASCTLVVTYAPTVAGTDSGTLQINYNNGISALNVSIGLAGTSNDPALLTIDDGTTLNFGTLPVTATADRTLTITNTGNFAASGLSDGATLAAPFSFKNSTYPGTGGTCTSTLAVAASCTVIVTYAPAATGTHSSTVTVAYNDGANAKTATRAVTGNGATAALLTISDSNYDFLAVAVGASASKTFTVSNNGGVSATAISGPAISSDYGYVGGNFPGTGGNCSAVLGAGATCTIVINFAPQSLGLKNASIPLSYNDGLITKSASGPIKGTGAAPALLVILPATSPVDFGSVQTGLFSDQTFTIRNDGDVPASGINLTGLGAPYTVSGGTYPGTGGTCGTSLGGSSATCTILIRFNPNTVGTQTGSMSVNYSTGAGSSSVGKSFTGIGTPPGAPTLTRTSPASPGTGSTVRLTASGVQQNETVKFYRDNACSGAAINTGVVANSATSIFFDDTLSVDGTYVYYASRTNLAGTVSACSASVSYTRDTTPPILTSAINFSPARSPHWSATPVIQVTGTFANDTIKIWSNNTCSTAVTQLAGYTGNTANITIPALALGSYNFYVTANDALNNQTACTLLSPVNYIYDTVPVTVQVASYFQTVTEGDTVNVAVQMSTSKPYPVQLNYRATGTALVNGSGSLGSSGSVTIPAGSTTANISFTATSNSGNQGNRFVDVALYDTNYEYVNVGGQVYHRVGINDNSVTLTPPVQLPQGYVAGQYGACFIDNNEKLYCLGRGASGVVGDGTTADRENYVPVAPSENFAKVQNGNEFACALTAAGGASYGAGAVLCWGLNSSGQLGDGTTGLKTNPTSVIGLSSGVRDIAVGGAFACAIKSDETLTCWGAGGNRQIRVNATSNSSTPVATDANLWTSITAGNQFACGIRKTTNAVFCWGRNNAGATGDKSTTDANKTAMVDVDNGVQYSQISSGEWTTCGVVSAADTNFPNQLRCWGSGTYGMMGRGNTSNSGTATSVDASNKYSQVSVGLQQTCGITTATNSPANALRCTGRGDLGMLLDRLGTDNVSTFQTVQLGTQFSKVSTGYLSTWALTTAGTVLYGGQESTFASSGDGVTTISKYANAATYFDQVNAHAKLDSGGGSERATCSITSNNKIRCVGGISDTQGMFGIGSAPDMTGYVNVDPKNDYIAVGAGRYAMCAIRIDGKLFCAGTNKYNGTTGNSNTLVALDAGNTYTALSVGLTSSCAIMTSGVVKCWGVNNWGQLGDGTTTDRSVPVIADGGTTYSKISTSNAHTCGITASTGRVRCWGAQHDGRLGNGSNATTGISSGADLTDNSVYTEISAGASFTCGITNSKLKCWGLNSQGQLGIGSTTAQIAPTAVDSANDYIKVATGLSNACAILANGKMNCWGDWTYGIAGQLQANQTTPQAMDAAFTFTDVTMGRIRGCGLTTANSVRCFGDGRFNAWGDYTRPWVPEALIAPGFIH